MAKLFFSLPVPMPIEKYNVIIFRAHILASKHALANIEPAIVTARHPNLFTNVLDIGPTINLFRVQFFRNYCRSKAYLNTK